jgi:hypothetical protein
MLHFLRRIRRSSLSSGTTRKYLLYAIGEVILVMVGILLALQVNNWNETHKNSVLESEFIQNIKSDLDQDRVNLTNVISEANGKIRLFDTMLLNMNNLYSNYPNKLDSIFILAFDPIPTFFPIDGTFRSESSSGNMGRFKDKTYVSSLYKLYTNYDRLLGNARKLDDTWTIRYEKYKNIRRTGTFGTLSEMQISEVLDDISRSSRHMKFYISRCQQILFELEKLLESK